MSSPLKNVRNLSSREYLREIRRTNVGNLEFCLKNYGSLQICVTFFACFIVNIIEPLPIMIFLLPKLSSLPPQSSFIAACIWVRFLSCFLSSRDFYWSSNRHVGYSVCRI